MSQTFLNVCFNITSCGIGLKFIRLYLFNGIDYNAIFPLLKIDKAIVFSISHERADYLRLISNVRSSLQNTYLIGELKGNKFRFSIVDIFVSFFQVFLLNFKGVEISFREKFFYFLKLVYIKNSISNLEGMNSSIETKVYVPFISSDQNCAIFCQFFRKRGVKSYGLQHGLHLPESYYEGRDIPADVFNIENFQADFFLAWGNCMKRILEGTNIKSDQILIAGNPNYQFINGLRSHQNYKRIIVCLGRSIYKGQNLELLNLLSHPRNKEFDIAVKIHPFDDWVNYEHIIESSGMIKVNKNLQLDETINQFNPDFVIVINSTLYYEYYMKGFLTLRYGDIRDLPIGLDDHFCTREQFIDILDLVKTKSVFEVNQKIENMLTDIFSIGENNYSNILSSNVST